MGPRSKKSYLAPPSMTRPKEPPSNPKRKRLPLENGRISSASAPTARDVCVENLSPRLLPTVEPAPGMNTNPRTPRCSGAETTTGAACMAGADCATGAGGG